MPEMKVSEFILPDEVANELRQGEEGIDTWRWRSGDMTADLVDEFGGLAGKGTVRKRVAIESGLGAATVRVREEIARFFSQEIRSEFEVLTWSQLRACKPAGAQGWRALAEWAVESADEFGGRPAPVDAIAAKRSGYMPKERTWEDVFMAAWNAVEEIIETGGMPKAIRAAAETFMEATTKQHNKISEAEVPAPA